jgi:hypothetical protein
VDIQILEIQRLIRFKNLRKTLIGHFSIIKKFIRGIEYKTQIGVTNVESSFDFLMQNVINPPSNLLSFVIPLIFRYNLSYCVFIFFLTPLE